MKIDILTLFPDFFSALLEWSIIGRAIEERKIDLGLVNIRDFSENKHRKVDDYPYGGGSGMLMTPQPIYNAISSVKNTSSKVVYLSPQGKKLNQQIVNDLALEEHIILLCGHYEGIDNRIIENYIDEEISIGDYVLTGGEIPAMVIIDAVVRLLPGVLTSEESYMEDSHYSGILEYPQYTRPRVFNGLEVPDILLSGNHKEIKKWRNYEALKSTLVKRPDLLNRLEEDENIRKIILEIKEEING